VSNLGGNAQRTRHMFNKAFLEALADHFGREGAKVIERVAKNQPAALASPEPQRAAQAATRTIPTSP